MDTNIEICSHTLVRNGTPFLDIVLRAVEPYVDRMLITISEKSTDGSLSIVNDFQEEFRRKVRVMYENVDNPAKLTLERQKMVDLTHEDWILFLDDDDYWPEESLKEIVDLITAEKEHLEIEWMDALAVSPIQVVDQQFYDKHWYEHKFFTKWFKNKDIHYVNPWPRDMILSGDKELYWKKNHLTKRLYGKYFHLSNIKNSSFRNEDWSKGNYVEPVKNKSLYPDWCKPYIEKIYARYYK